MAILLPDQDNARNSWRLITLMLMHHTPLHLINNVIFQVFMGFTLELVNGPHRIALIFILGGLLGSIVETLVGKRDEPTAALSCDTLP